MDEALTEGRAREILERWVRTTRMRRRGLATRLKIVSLTSPGAHRVTFQSSTETRSVVPAHVPYVGGVVDGPENGEVPGAWSIAVERPPPFIDHDARYEMPHSASVAQCFGCAGRTEVSCSACRGDGRVTCSGCSGMGSNTQTRSTTTTDSEGQTTTTSETYSETCMFCSGSGRVTCSGCAGRGCVTCPTCAGAGRLRHYQRLDVAWLNVVSVDVLEGTEIPDELVRVAEGRVVLLEEDPRVERTAGLPDAGAFRGARARVSAAIDASANRLIDKHQFPDKTKVLRQRLTVHAVPLHRIEYEWAKGTRCFFVYGSERVHAENYPVSIARVSALVALFAALAGAATFYFVSQPSDAPMSQIGDSPQAPANATTP